MHRTKPTRIIPFFACSSLTLAVSTLLFVGCGGSSPSSSSSSEPSVVVRTGPSSETADAPAELFVDPREVEAAWILERLRLALTESEREQVLADPAALERVLIRVLGAGEPLRGLPAGLMRNRSDAAEFFDQGVFHIKSFGPVAWSIPIDWSRADDGLTYLAELHSWRFLNDLLVAHEKTGEAKYFNAMEEAILDWIEANPFDAPAHARAWHEGAISKRVLILLNMLNHYRTRDEPSRVSRATLLALLIQHAVYLEWGEHYRAAGNHGIRQDIGQIALALGLPEAAQAEAWDEEARDRLRRLQFEQGFSREGVWKEHSPGYHYYVVRLLDDLITLLEANDRDVSFLNHDLERFQSYIAHVLTPAGQFPPVGDTDERPPFNIRALDGPVVQYAVSGGERGTPPAALDGFFPDAGEAVLRETWGDDERPMRESLYLHFRSAFHRGFGHRHHDDLSFLLFGHGRWWILEAGKWAYDAGPTRTFIESGSAHNTWTFNGETADPRRRGPVHARAWIEPDGVFTEAFAAVRAGTTRFPPSGTSATRTLVFLRHLHTVVLLDELRSDQPGDWTGYLHFPPDMIVTSSSSEDAVLLARTETHPELVLEVRSQEVGLNNLTLVRGQDDPLLGWYSPHSRELVPTTTAVFDRHGDDLTIATVIRLRDRDTAPIEALATTIDEDRFTVTWREGTVERRVTIDRGAPLAVRVDDLERAP